MASSVQPTTSSAIRSSSYNRSFVLTVSLIASLGGFMFGFDLGVITGVIPFIKRQFALDGFALGWVVAIFEIGCMVGTFLTADMADRLGRKKSLQLTALSFLVSTVGVALATGPLSIAGWRLAQGIGVGAASVLSPMYIAELAPAAIRGRLVALNQFTIIAGILAATLACYAFGDPAQLDSWRWMFGSALLPSVVFVLALLLIPESPRWLVKMGRTDAAIQVLRKLMPETQIRIELADIQSAMPQSESAAVLRLGTWKALGSPVVLPVLLVGIGLAVLQQFCGANNVTGYLQLIFEKAGISIKDGLLNAVFVMLVFLVFTVLAIVLIDRLGRRRLMLVGTFLMAVSLLLLAWSFSNDTVDGRLVLLFVMVYIGTFAFTLGPVVWVLLSELFPLSVRGKALSLCSGVLWLSTFLVVLVSPSLLRLSPVINFLLFAGLNIIGFGFVWRYVPETKGKTLEELESIVAGKHLGEIRATT
ncbi:sugar porter family MFS transporter [Fibrella aquatilis]|uniref:Sugar porter family MFS transporter n=1 Tax=Fibrella aquatilis TaxID=2817059 RepID=A0A939JWJ8_9BACT|nr:sugar porter family MFS transporter [Fibrella aquatilis]MBO0931987.1 sugar porter family MFS transporter [Fibrella aquatilis]